MEDHCAAGVVDPNELKPNRLCIGVRYIKLRLEVSEVAGFDTGHDGRRRPLLPWNDEKSVARELKIVGALYVEYLRPRRINRQAVRLAPRERVRNFVL